MSPHEALMQTIEWGYLQSTYKHKGDKPGNLVSRMGPEVREALSRLTSGDVANLPMWATDVEPEETLSRRRYSAILQKFDARLRTRINL